MHAWCTAARRRRPTRTDGDRVGDRPSYVSLLPCATRRRPSGSDRVKLPAMSRFFGQVATTSLRDSGPPVYCRCFRDDGGRVDRRRHVIRPAGRSVGAHGSDTLFSRMRLSSDRPGEPGQRHACSRDHAFILFWFQNYSKVRQRTIIRDFATSCLLGWWNLVLVIPDLITFLVLIYYYVVR